MKLKGQQRVHFILEIFRRRNNQKPQRAVSFQNLHKKVFFEIKSAANGPKIII